MVDDAASTDSAVTKLISYIKLPTLYLSHGPTRNKGHSQRESGLGLIRGLGLIGTPKNMIKLVYKTYIKPPGKTKRHHPHTGLYRFFGHNF